MDRLHLLSSLLLVSLIGCGGSDDYGAGAPSNSNVGFGGAQDIGQFRDLLLNGEIPGAATLDANGFFGEHFLKLPEPDCGQPLCLNGMVSVNRDWVDGQYQAVLRVALNSPVDPSTLQANPLDLVVVVDTSGSMADDDRLIYVKQGLSLLIDELGDDDRLGIVSYSSEANAITGLGESTNEELHAIVDGLNAQGGTNIYAGIELGMEMAAEQLSVERQSRVILLSDGLINTGRSSEDVLGLSEEYVSTGIGLTTIGVGDSFNVELMRGLAERGAGNFYFVEDPSAVTEVFTEELNYFVHPLALDLEVSVKTDPSHEIGQVYGTRLWEVLGADGGQMSIPAVFLSSRTTDDSGEGGRRGGGSSLLIEMDRIDGAFEGEAMATVHLKYRLPGTDERIEQDLTVDNPFREQAPEAGYVSHIEMLDTYAVYNVFLGLMRASIEAEEDHSCSLGTIEALESATQDWLDNTPGADLSEDLELIGMFAQNLRSNGADAQWCGSSADERTPWEEDTYYGDDVQACSAGGERGGPLSMAMLLLALGWLRRRRSNG